MPPSKALFWEKALRPAQRPGFSAEEAWLAAPSHGWGGEKCEPEMGTAQWMASFSSLSVAVVARMEQAERFASVNERLSALEVKLAEIAKIAAEPAATTFHIETFAPEAYNTRKPIPVVIRRCSETFVGSFVDANINSAGDNEQEAYANVRELILDVFDRLSGLPPSKLGPEPARQLAVLREFICVPHDHERARQ